ncbi:Similar to Orct: Organic cation transporter protein (Drosophila melanogaster) [Cotesia congregata]|uniref:Similar to Orct: Organic cation transporter protein (Drosophila melanogaster) n=1 Tax=Cotesia congregata TaxID=51543 RepID=A0A8J2MS86_COTCN|nr:Similar to Orct: Organic cation transporter protein (Drosophila melanogaster) [Cotesia congregata]
MYYSFFICLMACFYLVFNVDNFKVNRYVFMITMVIIELVSLFSVSIILKFLSSQKTTIILYWIASICLLSTIAIPKENVYMTVGLTVIISKLTLSPTFTTNMLFSLKLFPSSVRNSALGTCLLMSQAGSMSAPYLVDFLGKVAPWSPSVLCGVTLLIAGLLCCIVPTMENEKNKIQEKYLLQAIDELGKGSKLVWIAFFLSVTNSIVIALHTMSYIFLVEIPEHWCHIPELLDANWTNEQIQNISAVDRCLMYDYNYTHLAHLGYENAGKHVEDFLFNTSLVPCSSFVFDKSEKSTIVNEWSLICDRQFYRASTYLIYTFGKLLGLGGLGVFADKYGRKKALIIDESPRWLISQNRLDEAQKIIEKYRKVSISPGLLTESLPLKSLSIKQSIAAEEKRQESCMKRYLGNIGIFLADPIFRKKILIMYFSFFVCLMTSFYLVFSVDNFKVNRYVFMIAIVIIQITSLLLISVIIRFMSSQKTTIILYWIASVCLVSMIAVPNDNVYIILGLTIISKFCLSSTFTTNVLFSLKLFPSSVRNSALGSCLLMAQVGSMSAPYLVDFFGKIAPWSPSLLCGGALFIAGLLCCIVPIPGHWCYIPELLDANWTSEQIQNILAVDKCLKYDYNYAYLGHLGYENAVKHVEDSKFNTSLVPCSSFVFDKSGKSTIVNEWSLICDRKLYRANTYFVYSLGKLLGTGVLGVFADKYGRLKAIIIGLVLQMIAVPLTSIVPWFSGYILCELLIGLSVSTIYSSGYTIMSEIASEKKMKMLGTIVDINWSVGTCLLIVICFYVTDWRNLQIILSFIDESPRWLISQSRHDEAQKILEKYCEVAITPALITASIPLTSIPMEPSVTKEKYQPSCMERYLGNIGILFADPTYRKKILIMYFSFFVCVMVSFYLVLNIDNFEINRYVFITASAITETLSLLLVLSENDYYSLLDRIDLYAVNDYYSQRQCIFNFRTDGDI